jgi:hypothetical protein
MEQRQITPETKPLAPSFNEQSRPVLRHAGQPYRLAQGDLLAFTSEVLLFGFAPDEFALNVERMRGNRSASSAAPTFSVTVEHTRTGHTATYLGGPGRSWVAEFLIALIAGEFGRA